MGGSLLAVSRAPLLGGRSRLAASRAPLLGGRSLLAAREHSHKQLVSERQRGFTVSLVDKEHGDR